MVLDKVCDAFMVIFTIDTHVNGAKKAEMVH